MSDEALHPEYAHITAPFKRDGQGVFIPDNWADPTVKYMAPLDWLWTEKIDGMNIRVCWDGTTVVFRGRTDKANLPARLVDYLSQTFTAGKMAAAFEPGAAVTLYGEGYGEGIQRGGGYCPGQVKFILFDIRIGSWWLTWDSVCEIATRLAVDTVPLIYTGPLRDSFEMCHKPFASAVPGAMCPAEGLVCRPVLPVFDRAGRRVLVKVKVRDFTQKEVPL